jgi:hypothetical protein
MKCKPVYHKGRRFFKQLDHPALVPGKVVFVEYRRLSDGNVYAVADLVKDTQANRSYFVELADVSFMRSEDNINQSKIIT